MSKAKNLDEMVLQRGCCAMSAEVAEAVAMRVKIHLYRGSIELAREALEDGWSCHLCETCELPSGDALRPVPLARVLDNLRVLNMLEREGIATVGELVGTSAGSLLAIPNLGTITASKIARLADSLRERLADEECRGT